MLVSPVEVRQKKDMNKYVFAVAASKRAKEINSGSPSVVKPMSSKPVTIAIEEILQDKVTVVKGEE